jgi:kynurenine formamidase
VTVPYLLEAIARGPRQYDLAQPLHQGVPCSPNHPGFRFALQRRHGDRVRADGGSAASELIVTGGHVGTHVDALAHVSQDGLLHGGVEASEAQLGGRFSRLGTDELPIIVARGVLLDVVPEGARRLPPGFPIGPDELIQAGGRDLRAGDVALIRTGWAQLWDDPIAFLSHDDGVPGVTEAGARWLVDRGIQATGADTTAYEHIPAGQGHALLPAHRVLLVEAGVPIVEMLNLEALARDGIRECCFVLAPLPIVGGTGSPVRPFALVDDAS